MKIVEDLRKRGYVLELVSSYPTEKILYGARFTNSPNNGFPSWDVFIHADTIEEVIKLAAADVLTTSEIISLLQEQGYTLKLCVVNGDFIATFGTSGLCVFGRSKTIDGAIKLAYKEVS